MLVLNFYKQYKCKFALKSPSLKLEFSVDMIESKIWEYFSFIKNLLSLTVCLNVRMIDYLLLYIIATKTVLWIFH